MRIKILILCILGLLVVPGLVTRVQASGELNQVQPQESQPAIIYFFWGDGCPHCERAKPFLEGLVRDNPGLELRSYEIWNNATNRDFFARVMAAHNLEPRYVPVIFIGDRYWEGYREELNAEIEAAALACLDSACPDTAQGIALPLGSEGASRSLPWPLLVAFAAIAGAGLGGYLFYQSRAKERQRLRRVATRQSRRKNKS